MAADNPPDRTGDPQPSPLVPGPAPVKRRGPWRILLLVALLGGLIWGSAALYSYLKSVSSVDSRGALTYEVSRNPLQVIVTADGNVESASNLEVRCRVAGGGTILWIVEDGKIVDEGEVVVRLDTSALDDKLNSQRITYEKALATQIQAQEDLESAKISVKEYEEGTFIEQLQQAEAGIRIALENLRSAENQLNYSKRMVRKGFVSSLQREADEFGVERAKLDLDAANTRKKVLVEFTKPKTLRDLEANREAATARLRSEQAGLELEKARLERLKEQLKNCVITAPQKGMVVYANESRGSSRYGGSQQALIEEGAMVRESQTIVRLPDLSKMQVKVTIHESRVDQVRSGLAAQIVIQGLEYAGSVLSVANQPQASSFFSANVKEYATTVSIDGGTGGLRPGMTAKVTILIDNLTDALTVPVSAVVEQKGRFFSWVKTPRGPERRPMKLGRTNDKLIEVVDGVKEGEEVYRNPRAMVEEAREEPPFEKQAEDARFGAAGGMDSGAVSSPPIPPGTAAGPAEKEGVESALPPPGGTAAQLPPGAEPRGEGPPGESSKRGGRFDLMQYDKDGDKKLSREELPERMQPIMERADSNADGFLDASEMAEMRRRRPGGGGRPGGSGENGAGGDRPEGSSDGAGRRGGAGSAGDPPGGAEGPP